MEDVWIYVEGELIGWLEQNDSTERAIAVIKIGRKGPADRPQSIYDDVIGWLPGFCLRFLGHDYQNHSDNDTVEIGDKISFTTCRREQEEYAKR